VLMHSCRRKVTLLGKAECVTMTVARRLFRSRTGEMVGVFHAGTRSRDGLLREGQVGVAHPALKRGAPIDRGRAPSDGARPRSSRISHRRVAASGRPSSSAADSGVRGSTLLTMTAVVWHYWIAVPLAASAVIIAIMLIAGYVGTVSRARYPRD